MKKLVTISLAVILLAQAVMAQNGGAAAAPRIKTKNGILEGVNEKSGIRSFKGIPFAAPPVGDLRWKEPQPAKSWNGVRKADKFGPRAMQRFIYTDMMFRSDSVSEDCLYLNVWTPARSGSERLPVLVYFYGGGFTAGDGSELRYDGESMATKGMVAITVNYRLGIFGFFAHPGLTKESPHHASGNYGLLDQSAALQWVRDNITAFGGNPSKVTIAGESAGSYSVSAQMASPLSRNLIAGAIGESGSLLGGRSVVPLAEAEQMGAQFAGTVGAASLADLRAMPVATLLEATAKPGVGRFPVTVDGYFFPRSPVEIYAAGEQAKVPLLAGWNSEEGNYRSITGQGETTVDGYKAAVQKLYGDKANEVLALYAATTPAEVEQAGTDLASDRFIGFSTWKWTDMHGKTSGRPVYRYMFYRARPALNNGSAHAQPPAGGSGIKEKDDAARMQHPRGAVHSGEIEYALGNLGTNKVYAWEPDDYKVSDITQRYFANFIKTGDPNGQGLPPWPAANGSKGVQVMHLDVNSGAAPEQHRERYLFLDKLK